MNTLLQYFNSDTWQALATTLLHTLWQAPLIAVAMVLILRHVPARCCQTRYRLSLLALTGVVLTGMITQGILLETHRHAGPNSATANTQDINYPAINLNDVETSLPSKTNKPAISALPNHETTTEFTTNSIANNGIANWAPIIALVWIVGVLVMLIRTGIGLIFLRQYTTIGSPNAAPKSVTSTIETLASAMNITRRIRVSVTDKLNNPAVAGIFWPTILLPPAMILNLPAEQLRIVLAHELAHILRHDYLVNLLQKLIEALLFFNPGVWWISRQVRIERESCCDELATQIIGDRHAVAHVLYGFAKKPAEPRLATIGLTVAFGRQDKNSMLVNRIQRLARPSVSPAIRMRWYSFILFVTAIFAGIWVTGYGVNGAVQIAAKVLNGPEHIDKIQNIQTQYGKTNSIKHRKALQEECISISGTVRTHDGAALPPKTNCHISADAGNYCSSYSSCVKPDGTWVKDNIHGGTVVITIIAEGYAPAVAGPFELEPSDTMGNIDLVLEEGFSMKLQLLDPQGQPVPDVPVTLVSTILDTWAGERIVHTDSSGIATLKHLANCELTVDINQPGFERIKRKIEVVPNGTELLRFSPGRPVTGQVVSAATGAPLPDVKIRSIYNSIEGSFHDPRSQTEQEPLAVTDQNGNFRIDSLDSGAAYTLWFEAPDYRPEIVYSISSGTQNLNIELAEPIVLVAEIVGQVEVLPCGKNDQYVLNYRQSLKYGPTHYYRYRDIVTVDARDGKFFAVLDKRILPGSLTIVTPEPLFDVKVDDTTQTKRVLVNLNPESKREYRTVIFNINQPKGWPTPEGYLRVYPTELTDNWNQSSDVELKGGQVAVEIPLNENGVQMLHCGPLHSPGYWIPDEYDVTIGKGAEPYVIEIDALPAGSIFGTIVDEQDKPVVNGLVSLKTIEEPEGITVDSNRLQTYTDAKGQFSINCIPLGGTYKVVGNGRINTSNKVWSEPISVNAEQPTRDIRLVIPHGIDVPVQVWGPEGLPIPRAEIDLHFKSSDGGSSGPVRNCDATGQFTFKGVNFDLPGTYYVVVNPTATLTGVRVEVDPMRPTTAIVLQKGHRLVGVLINHETGAPIPGREVTARPYFRDYLMAQYRDSIRTQTNSRGEFLFQNLEPITYQLEADRTARFDATVTKNPNGSISFKYSDTTKDLTPKVQLPRESEEPFELRVIPY